VEFFCTLCHIQLTITSIAIFSVRVLFLALIFNAFVMAALQE
jgi:hypothetical protein